MTMKVALICMCVCLYLVAVSANPRKECYRPKPKPNRPKRSPLPGDRDQGDWNLGVNRTRDEGARVRVEAQQRWDITKDKKVQAEVHGHWERQYGGANQGLRDHGYGGSIGGTWGK